MTQKTTTVRTVVKTESLLERIIAHAGIDPLSAVIEETELGRLVMVGKCKVGFTVKSSCPACHYYYEEPQRLR